MLDLNVARIPNTISMMLSQYLLLMNCSVESISSGGSRKRQYQCALKAYLTIISTKVFEYGKKLRLLPIPLKNT